MSPILNVIERSNASFQVSSNPPPKGIGPQLNWNHPPRGSFIGCSILSDFAFLLSPLLDLTALIACYGWQTVHQAESNPEAAIPSSSSSSLLYIYTPLPAHAPCKVGIRGLAWWVDGLEPHNPQSVEHAIYKLTIHGTRKKANPIACIVHKCNIIEAWRSQKDFLDHFFKFLFYFFIPIYSSTTSISYIVPIARVIMRYWIDLK